MNLRDLPAVHVLLADPRLAALPHALAADVTRQALDQARAAIRAGEPVDEDLAALALALAEARRRPALQHTINATGVVIHTNLGRAPLPPEAAAAVADVARGYSNLELMLHGPDAGQRGGRLDGVGPALCRLTGAQAAIAVNNNAAATLLALTALARGQEVLVSRGELVEIGGSFRVPDVISAGGARMVGVGTTNRTRVADFADAITDQTAVLLRVHPSNFRIQGFTERPDRAGLVALARERGLLVVEDLGSGLLSTGPGHPPLVGGGWPDDEEPVDAVLATGVDVVCFSGDKLLGGPQAGLLAGRAETIGRLRRHALYRALRLDKLALAALEATLRMYDEGRADQVPVRRMLAATDAALRPAAEALAAAIPGAVVEDDVGYTGGGALPGRGLATPVVAVRTGAPDALLAGLRAHAPPIVARVARDALVLDPRTLLPGEAAVVILAVNALVAAAAAKR